jgi:lipopolysaccharide transport system permease protein
MAAEQVGADIETVLIKPGRSSQGYWVDFWRYRELFYFLAWRDLLVRYKQTVIGVAWALLRPAIAIAVFSLVFGKLAGLPSGGVPYPIMVCVALLPWHFFASAFSGAAESLVSNASVVTKVYFPRIVLPLSTIVVSLVDFLISAVVLVLLMGWYGYWPDRHILALPLFILLVVGAAAGAGLWVAALNVTYRDLRFVVPFALQLGLYISPVGFSSALVPERWRLLYSANPMVGVIDGFRWALLGSASDVYWPGLLLSTGVVMVLLASGILFFRRTERAFADII